MIRARDLIERVFWSFVSGFIGSFLGAPLVIQVIENAADTDIDLTTLGAVVVAAAFAGVTAAANVVLVIARWRLSVLPNPGEGLPGLPTGDAGATTIGLAGGLTVLLAAALTLAFLLPVT